MINNAKIFTDYIVLYLPNNFNKLHSVKYDYRPMFTNIFLGVEISLDKINYAKKNNIVRGVKSLDCNEEDINDEIIFKSSIEFTVTQKDIERNIIIIEASYNILNEDYYGFYDIRFFNEESNIPISISFIINDNFFISKSDKKSFTYISKSKSFSFKTEELQLIMRDKSIKLNIKNELSEKLLSKFSDEEIEQINFSLNEMEINFGTDNLIYHKIIHNIKNKKDYIKMYYFVFFPHLGRSYHDASEDSYDKEPPIVIKKFTINNKLVKNAEDNSKNYDDENNSKDNEEKVYGDYISNTLNLKFNYKYNGIFQLFELDCESNENLKDFQLDCSSFVTPLYFKYKSSFKYEIILNGNSIKFSNKYFQYKIINDKIIFKGYLDACEDNYNFQKYLEMAKRSNDKDYYMNVSKEERPQKYMWLRKEDLIPDKMNLIKKNRIYF